jgi:hypothetical protein
MNMADISGTVRSTDGNPIEGVVVMGADLNYDETDSDGQFYLPRPEMALFFWCTGFVPKVRVLSADDRRVEIVLHSSTAARASA